jgi:hypothetical protein
MECSSCRAHIGLVVFELGVDIEAVTMELEIRSTAVHRLARSQHSGCFLVAQSSEMACIAEILQQGRMNAAAAGLATKFATDRCVGMLAGPIGHLILGRALRRKIRSDSAGGKLQAKTVDIRQTCQCRLCEGS